MEVQKFSPLIIIFGAIEIDYKSYLFIVDSTINSEVYQAILSQSKINWINSQKAIVETTQLVINIINIAEIFSSEVRGLN